MVADVRVGKENQFSPGPRGALRQGVRLAEPSLRELRPGHNLKPRILPRKAFEDLRGRVGGPVLDHDHLEIAIVLREVGPHSRLHVTLFVAGRNDD